MPSTPIQRACVVPALCAALNWSGVVLAAELPRPAHPHATKTTDGTIKPVPAPIPATTAAPPTAALPAALPAAAAQPAPPAGPLRNAAVAVAHGEKSLVEAVAHAGARLVAVGVNGLILLSDDDGLSWRQVLPPVQATLTGVAFADDKTGWAIGHYGAVLRTEDAGESWVLVLDASRAAQITLDAALASNTSDTNRRKAIDAARRMADADPSRPFLLMQTVGVDALRVIGAGGMALATEDGGRHWHAWSAAIDNPDALPLLGMAERDGVMLVGGARGILLAGRPEDGLARLRSPTDATLFGALDAGRYGLLLFGQQGNAFNGTLAQPAAATRTDAWRQVDTPTQNSFTAALLKRNGTALLGDSAGMVWTLDGRPDDPRLDPAAPRAPFPILSMVETADGALVLAGSGGLLRIEPPAQAATAAAVASPATAPQAPAAQPTPQRSTPAPASTAPTAPAPASVPVPPTDPVPATAKPASARPASPAARDTGRNTDG